MEESCYGQGISFRRTAWIETHDWAIHVLSSRRKMMYLRRHQCPSKVGYAFTVMNTHKWYRDCHVCALFFEEKFKTLVSKFWGINSSHFKLFCFFKKQKKSEVLLPLMSEGDKSCPLLGEKMRMYPCSNWTNPVFCSVFPSPSAHADAFRVHFPSPTLLSFPQGASGWSPPNSPFAADMRRLPAEHRGPLFPEGHRSVLARRLPQLRPVWLQAGRSGETVVLQTGQKALQKGLSQVHSPLLPPSLPFFWPFSFALVISWVQLVSKDP